MLDQSIASITVSYTHLDVYKRQLFGSVTSKEIADILLDQYKIKIDKKKIVLEDGIKALGVMKIPVKLHAGITAVSYTHLDVYKRQLLYSR